MKTYFRIGISSFVTMIILIGIFVLLTSNSRTQEPTKLGKVYTNSQNSTVYIAATDFSFDVSPNADIYFSDTKNNWVSGYMSRCGYTFASETEDGIEFCITTDYEMPGASLENAGATGERTSQENTDSANTDASQGNTDSANTDANQENTDFANTDANQENTDFANTDASQGNTDSANTDASQENMDSANTDASQENTDSAGTNSNLENLELLENIYSDCVAADEKNGYKFLGCYSGEPFFNENTGMTLAHVYCSRKAVSGAEYTFSSDFIGVMGDRILVFTFVIYNDKEIAFEDGKRFADEYAYMVMKSVTFGDATRGKKENKGVIRTILSTSFSLWIFLIPVFYFLFGNVKVASESGEWTDNILGRSKSKNILGVFAILIVLHHLVQSIGVQNAGLIGILEECGVLFVGVYFFYSGYGLFLSYKSRKGYLDGFLVKRLPTVLIPFYVCNLIFVINSIIVDGQQDFAKTVFSLKKLLSLTGVYLVNDHMWYIVEITILYLMFWLCFRFIKNENAALSVLTALTLLLINLSLLLGHGDKWFQGEWWYNTTLLFIIGMLVAKFRDRFVNGCKKYYGLICTVTFVLFVVFFGWTRHMLDAHGYWTEGTGISLANSIADKYMTLSVQLPAVICFTFLIILIGMKVSCNNAVLDFFGRISLELYLIHNLFIRSFVFIKGAGMYFLMVIVASIICACLINKLDTALLCRLLKKPLPEKKDYSIYFRNFYAYCRKAFVAEVNLIKYSPKNAIKRAMREIICFGITGATFFPIYVMAVNATKKKIVGQPLLVPGKFFLDNLASIEGAFSGPGGSIIREYLIPA